MTTEKLTAAEINDHIQWLMSHKYDYHFDDDPADCLRNLRLTDGEMEHIETMHERMWNSDVGPWEVMDLYPDTYKRLMA